MVHFSTSDDAKASGSDLGPSRRPQDDREQEDLDATVADHESGSHRRLVRPTHIGPYQIVELLGEGGMGEVYLGEQTDPVTRRVAIKVVRGGFSSHKAELRFQAELEALARLSHPNIAQLLDAGTDSDSSFLYCVLELIEGHSLLRHCDQHRLTIEERIDLFAAVCKGIEHAHRKGVLHRDLKPSNVLIAASEGRWVPKIIDFGIAKALDQPLTSEALETGRGLVGTPAYMSSEALLKIEDIDTRSDIYSLGILLCELVTGTRPFAEIDDSLPQMVRAADREAPRASLLFHTLGEERQSIAEARATRPQQLEKRLTHELDWIIGKAVARDREHRYGSVLELRIDLEKHLRHEPISARPPSVGYRATRFIRRHQVAVLASAVVVLALLLGILGTTAGMNRARRAEEQARAEAESARQVANYLVELFENSEPNRSGGKEVTAREVLDRGALRIEHELADQPLVKARMMSALGRVYRQLGHFDQARPLLEEALVLRSSSLQPDTYELAQSSVDLGDLLSDIGEYEGAIAAYSRALELFERSQVPRELERMNTLRSLAAAHLRHGQFDQAKAMLEDALETATTTAGPNSLEVATVLGSLSSALAYQGHFQEAEPLMVEALAIQRAALGDLHLSTLASMTRLATLTGHLGRFAEGEPMALEALAGYEQLLGEGHPKVRMALANLGYRLFLEERFQDARHYLERAVELAESAGELEAAGSASMLTNLGLVYWRLGKLEEAEPLLLQASEIRRKTLSPDHPHHATSWWGLANVYRDSGRLDEAETLYRRALELRQLSLPAGHVELDQALVEYSVLLRTLGRESEADALEQQRTEDHRE